MDIESIRSIAKALPKVTEDVKWDNDLCFCIGGRMFCVTSLDPPFKIAFKVKDEEFEEWSTSDGFIPAPYMARAKWVLMEDPNKLNKKELEKRIKISYELVKAKLTKKARKDLVL